MILSDDMMVTTLMTGRNAMEIIWNREKVIVQKTLRRIIIAAMKWTLLTVVFIGKDKTKWGMVNKLCTYSTQVAKYLTELPGVIGQARKAASPFEAWKYPITDEILDKVVQKTSVYSYRTYFQPGK